jgi:hypothetical protein
VLDQGLRKLFEVRIAVLVAHGLVLEGHGGSDVSELLFGHSMRLALDGVFKVELGIRA